MMQLFPRALSGFPLVWVLALLVAATACTGTDDGPLRPSGSLPTATGNKGVLDLPWNLEGPAPTGTGSSLYDTEWVLSYIQIGDHMSWADEFLWGLTLVFRRDGTVYIRSDCGDWKAGTTAEEGTPISGGTRIRSRPCLTEAETAQQDRLHSLDQPLKYVLGKDNLILVTTPQGGFYDFVFTTKP
ncbi:hypothetical protein [Streptomyces sp. NPDC088757]|uniref:hypothetical protein n=1 Tax=Streptomyces sp. NPDC088757 TaxID=3365889 RepID=UPI0037FBF502